MEEGMKGNRFLEIARKTGTQIITGDATIWQGPATGKRKPVGPLSGKRIGIITASEFSDFQAYYLALYITEFGGAADFLTVDWVKWKHTRPTLAAKGVQGMWGVALDPIPTMPGGRQEHRSFRDAQPQEYDALVVPGGHSADLLMTETEVTGFLRSAYDIGAVVGAIGSGSLPLVSSGILSGKALTGDALVSYLLERVGTFTGDRVTRDGRIITAKETAATPLFVRELCGSLDDGFHDERDGLLDGKRIVIVAGEDFEDVELAVPVMEFLYRGAAVTLGTFPAPLRSRPPLLGLDVVMGNFGVSVPLQEVPEHMYDLKQLSQIDPDDFDLVQIPGAFCPWNMVAAETPIEWLRSAHEAGKLIAPICHGAIPVAAADLVSGRKIAGVGAVKDHVTIMGGTYNPEWSAVIDGQIVSGRVPVDIPEFIDAMTAAMLGTPSSV